MYFTGFCACDDFDLFRLHCPTILQQCCMCCSADSCLRTRFANICRSVFETAAVAGSIACTAGARGWGRGRGGVGVGVGVGGCVGVRVLVACDKVSVT